LALGRYDTIEEILLLQDMVKLQHVEDVACKTECDQLNLAHVTRNKNITSSQANLFVPRFEILFQVDTIRYGS